MNIIEALRDRRFFGSLPQFKDLTTWRAWLTVLKAIYGLPMDEQDLETFRKHTGRRFPRAGGYPETVIITGRQSGKSQIAAVLAVFEAATSKTRTGALLIAQGFRAAQRVLFGYCKEIIDGVAALSQELDRSTADMLQFLSGASVDVFPCTARSVRGTRKKVAIGDEVAWWLTTEGNPVDEEVLRAIRPTLATTGGKLIILSSPYAQTGALWDLHRKHFGVEDSDTLVWQASAPDMNPLLPSDYLERMRANDPDGARAEIDGEFRSGLSMLFDPDAIQACVPEGVREREARPGVRYSAFADPASGSGADSFTLAIAHANLMRAELDAVFVWDPPFNPTEVIKEASAILKRFHIHVVTGDHYAAGFVIEGFRSNRITFQHSERDRSTIYLELLPSINSGSVALLDHPDLLRQLRGLQRRRGTAGRDRVDHRPGSHDDIANAAAGALVLASPQQKSRVFVGVWDLDTQTPRSGVWNGLEWKNGKPWAGICPPDKDINGRPINKPAIFRDGRIVGYVE